MRIEFRAPEYRDDGTFKEAAYAFDGEQDTGWRIERGTGRSLRLGAGYRPLRVMRCGICSTDLARHLLPFPLPQITGHEVLAADEHGRRYVVEINASHRARGLAVEACERCAGGLHTHCPERVVLGIHDLPGGFGPWILAPVDACLEVPTAMPNDTAVLVEPFAAALNAVETVRPRAGEHICVLGPRRLGMLALAALAAWRRKEKVDFRIVAAVRRPALGDLARVMGADDVIDVTGGPMAPVDVVIDTTGTPQGLEVAVGAARREVHLKSTHGRAACGLRHLTELVVDELSVAPWVEGAPAPATSAEDIDGRIRPEPGCETAAVPPRGTIFFRPKGRKYLISKASVGLPGRRLRCEHSHSRVDCRGRDAHQIIHEKPRKAPK